jgi:glutamine synthetase
MVSDMSDRAARFSRTLDDLGATHVHIGIFDRDGTFRHKRVDRAKAEKMAATGYAFCDVLYLWDIAEETYGGGAFVDRPATLDPDSVRPWPFADNAAMCIADFDPPFGERSARVQLQRQMDKARTLGLSAHAAFEFEFLLFDETPETLRAKGHRDLTNFAQGNRTYSMQTVALHQDLLGGLERTLGRVGLTLDSLHTELGPGTLEAPLVAADGVTAADQAALFKNITKAYFLRQGLTACFMAKSSNDLPGQSGHLHISLRTLADDSPAFWDDARPDRLSDLARHFIGGLVLLMPDLLALCSHTVNAYRRLVPGAWAPTYASWGVQNRTAAVRVVNTSPDSMRIEFRVPAADTNPHAALAMALAAGLWGIETRTEPPPPRTDDCYLTPPPPAAAFPPDLRTAADRLAASKQARDLFGDTFVEDFAFACRREDEAWRRHVGAWDRRRYLEIV